MSAPKQQWTAAWTAALEAMELEADTVERMLRHRDGLQQPTDGALFAPPEGIGPLPMELTERARVLMGRQLELSRELSLAIIGNRQQARLVSRLQREGPKGQMPPVYIDNRA
jgi:hypothetical protein